MDIQRIKTAILRQLLDNMYLANNQRTEIAESHANENTIDDWLTNRPGGLVRTRTPGGLLPIPNTEIGSFGYPLLEYWDNQREWRTGVSRQGQGIGSESLKNVGEEVLLSMFNMAQQKMRLIARVFAETGVRDMFLLLHAVTRRNATRADTVRLKKKWVDIEPNKWRRRDDMTVTVGLGSGSKAQQVQFLMSLLGLQKEAIMAPELGLVDAKNIYNTVKRLVEASGFRSVDPFFNDPEEQEEGQEQQQPPPDPEMAKAQAEVRLEQQKAQISAQQESEKIRLQHEAKMAELQMEERMRIRQQDIEATLKREQMSTEAQVKMGAAVVDGMTKTEPEIGDVKMGGEVG